MYLYVAGVGHHHLGITTQYDSGVIKRSELDLTHGYHHSGIITGIA